MLMMCIHLDHRMFISISFTKYPMFGFEITNLPLYWMNSHSVKFIGIDSETVAEKSLTVLDTPDTEALVYIVFCISLECN